MTSEEFEQLVAEEFPNAIPEKFRSIISNLAFLVEDEPDTETRSAEKLHKNETLLGLYHGVPYPLRGDLYGVGAVLPDTITLYQKPIEDEARAMEHTHKLENVRMTFEVCVRTVVRETIWHEVAHHFGMDEHTVRRREDER